MSTDDTETPTDGAWNGGFVCGLLTARFYSLRHANTDQFFRTAAPTEVPEVVYSLMATMCRDAIDHRLFETSWASLDHLLLCDSKDELQGALKAVPDYRLQ